MTVEHALDWIRQSHPEVDNPEYLVALVADLVAIPAVSGVVSDMGPNKNKETHDGAE